MDPLERQRRLHEPRSIDNDCGNQSPFTWHTPDSSDDAPAGSSRDYDLRTFTYCDGTLHILFKEREFTDVIFICEDGANIEAHKFILAARSESVHSQLLHFSVDYVQIYVFIIALPLGALVKPHPGSPRAYGSIHAANFLKYTQSKPSVDLKLPCCPLF